MTTATETSIPVRRVSFEESLRDLPKHFAGDDFVSSHIVAVLSSVFPEGEEYFVRSVRHYRDQITDPDLKQAVKGFIGQETVHGREHRAFNERLAEHGYPTLQIDRRVGKVLRKIEQMNSPEENLAVTAALEHFTACMGELLLETDLEDYIGHEQVRQMFLWHALEETEHKAVALDVYRAVGGTEKVRTRIMNQVTFGFLTTMAVRVVLSLLRDRATYNPFRLARSIRRTASAPLFSMAMWRKLRSYNRPGFHPHDIDTTELVERARTELFGAEGRISDKLPAGAAA
jgi:uncharacterized protein